MTRLQKKQEETRVDEIQGFVDFAISVLREEQGHCLREICNRTGLSMSTIIRLTSGKFSSAVRIGTVQKLGTAAGLSLKLYKPRQAARVA